MDEWRTLRRVPAESGKPRGRAGGLENSEILNILSGIVGNCRELSGLHGAPPAFGCSCMGGLPAWGEAMRAVITGICDGSGLSLTAGERQGSRHAMLCVAARRYLLFKKVKILTPVLELSKLTSH